MAIDSQAKRNAALKDTCGVLIPAWPIGPPPVDAIGRQTLLGDYYVGSAPPPAGPGNASGTIVTYIPMNR